MVGRRDPTLASLELTALVYDVDEDITVDDNDDTYEVDVVTVQHNKDEFDHLILKVQVSFCVLSNLKAK